VSAGSVDAAAPRVIGVERAAAELAAGRVDASLRREIAHVFRRIKREILRQPFFTHHRGAS
jgi:hypothetical protein